MVSKLLLAVQEVLNHAMGAGEESPYRAHHQPYHEIREGIGVHKSPELYGGDPH